MSQAHDAERKPSLADEDLATAKAGDQGGQQGSFVGGHAAARGMSPGMLQRKIQRRATERHGAADSGATEAGATHGAPAGAGSGGAADETEDANVVELKTKVGALVNQRFGGDFKKAFEHYDTSHDGGVNKDELINLLKDAGVGSGFTRGIWASKIIEKMDGNHDGKIQWSEFEAGLKGGG